MEAAAMAAQIERCHMNLKNQPPVLVPQEYWKEMEELSKAALMDIVWDYAKSHAGDPDENVIIEDLRRVRNFVINQRKREAKPKAEATHMVMPRNLTQVSSYCCKCGAYFSHYRELVDHIKTSKRVERGFE